MCNSDNDNGGWESTLYWAYSCAKCIKSTLGMEAMGSKTTKIIIVKFLDRGKKKEKSQLRKVLSLERQILYEVSINSKWFW